MSQSVQTKYKMLATELRRGYENAALLIESEDDFLPPHEIKQAFHVRLQELLEVQRELSKAIGITNRTRFNKLWRDKPNEHPKSKMACEYFLVKSEIERITQGIIKINNLTRSKDAKLTFSLIFMGCAREMLPDDVYEKILKKAQMLENSNFTGTREEWKKFVDTL